MNLLKARLNNLLERKKQISIPISAISPVVIEVNELRSSGTSNPPNHSSMSISMIASLIKNSHADVRIVAQKITETQGFNTFPQLVSREEIDRKVLNDNELLLFVGLRDLPKTKFHAEFSSNDRVKDIKNGNNYLVNGILGPAIYAVQAIRDPKAKDNDEEAIMYAYKQAEEYSKSDNKKGSVLRMCLKADARVISYYNFLQLLTMNNAQIKGELQNHPGFTPYLNLFLNTPTLVAMAQGYDAITQIPDGTVVILNRGALRIQKTNANSRNAMYAQIMAEIEKEEEIAKEKKKIEDKKKSEKKARQLEQEKRSAANKKEDRILLDSNDSEDDGKDKKSISTKSYNLWQFDANIVHETIENKELTVSEKQEILNFVSQYNNAPESLRRNISEQLKEMLSI